MVHRTTHPARRVGILALITVVAACSDPPASSDAGSSGESGASQSTDPSADGTDGPATTTPGDSGSDGPVEPPVGDARVLMFVGFNQTWWPEYKVMREGLEAAGYEVDVRSSTADAVAHSYGDRVDEVTPGLDGVDPIAYGAFEDLFAANFGVSWDPAWNEPGTIPLDGRIQDAVIDDYVAVVFPGGSGSQFTRYDGDYVALPNETGFPEHVSPREDIASAAAAINDLVIGALVRDLPVLAVCHAGPTPGFARVPGTEGQGPDGLGRSLLDGRSATGFPLDIEVFGAVGDVADQYAALGIEFRPQQVVVVDGPGIDLDGDGDLDGEGLVVTARSWYPEEVALGLRAMLDARQ